MARKTLAQRAAAYFGAGNAARMTGVSLGRRTYALVRRDALWIYDDQYRPDGMVIPLTAKQRADLLAALGGTNDGE